MLTKVCRICGIEKSLEEFYIRNDSDSYRAGCKTCLNEQNKKWRARNLNYMNNHVRKHAKIYRSSPARYVTYNEKINFSEETKDNNGLLEVHCTYCNKWFSPTNSQLNSRIGALSRKTAGESRFYCSEDCKKACPIYYQKKYEKGTKLGSSREVPAEFRKLALEDRNHTCEKCGSKENGLNVHHIEGYSEQPMFMADLCNVLVVCKKCHREIHKQPGCSYSDYGLCKIEQKSLDK